MRVLGLMSATEHPVYPAKTFRSQGYELTDYNTFGWLLPAGVPTEVVESLASAFKKIAESGEFQTKMTNVGSTPYYMGPKEFTAYWDEIDVLIGPLLEAVKAEQQ